MTTLAEWIPLEKKFCLFIGAGFSKWAINLPIAKELFDYNIKPWGPNEIKKLNELQQIKMMWDNANLSVNPEEFIRIMIESPKKEKQLIIWYIARRLAEPFIVESNPIHHRRQVMMIDDTRKNKILGVLKARNFIESLLGPSLEGIITTNYDMLIEYSLGTKRFNYGKKMQMLHGQWAMPIRRLREGPVFLKGDLPLIKLHGSISKTDKGYCTDGRGGINGRAYIIPPTQNKQIMDFVADEWQIANKILKNSDAIIFFGFAFNEYDVNILDLLKSTEKWIKKVILINRNPLISDQAKKIWPSAGITFINSDNLNEGLLNILDSKKVS